MKQMLSQCVRSALAGAGPLYAAVFAMAISLSVMWTSMPFIIRDIGGTEEHVGLVWAANMVGYLVCVLAGAAMLGHLNPRHTTRTAAAVMLLSCAVMITVVHHVISNDRFGDAFMIWTMIVTGTVAGGAMSLFWPFLMTWVSADYEGIVLNRRLGAYNGMWSGAAIIGPVISGVLVDRNTLWPLVMGMGSLAICFSLLCLSHDRSAGTFASVRAPDYVEVSLDKRMMTRLRWMARVTLFCSWACLGVTRSQFALLFTEMGFSETQFGMLVTLFGICNFLALTGAGRIGFWHFKSYLLPVTQAVLALSLIMLVYGSSLLMFAASLAVMGFSFGFAYSSHLYYGAAGSKNRTAPMAIHEATISVGVIVGSGAGGYIARSYSTYWPYWFAIILLGVGLGAQLIIWATVRPRPAKAA